MDAYVLETLMGDLVGHDRRPAAFLVYLHLWARSAGTRPRRAVASYRDIAADTGLSRRAVQDAVASLVRRRLLDVRKANPTATPEYRILRPWKR